MADWARGGLQDLSALSCDPTQLPKLPEMAPEETTASILYLMSCPSSDFSLSNYMMLAFSHQFPRNLRLCSVPFSPCVLSLNSQGCQSSFFLWAFLMIIHSVWVSMFSFTWMWNQKHNLNNNNQSQHHNHKNNNKHNHSTNHNDSPKHNNHNHKHYTTTTTTQTPTNRTPSM